MANPFDVVRQFEDALCDYTGAPYCVTVTSCTMALLLSCAWFLGGRFGQMSNDPRRLQGEPDCVELPKRTYVGVAMSVLNAGGRPVFRDEKWNGLYKLEPFPIFDSARWLSRGMYRGARTTIESNSFGAIEEVTRVRDMSGSFVCLSFHHTKHLGISTHGGAILLDDAEAAAWLRRARFDGRTEGVSPRKDVFRHIGFHCYMTPPTAAEGLLRLASLHDDNAPLPWGPGTASDYPDLSGMEVFW